MNFKDKILALDRYGKDVDEFICMINKIANDSCDYTLDALFLTFNNDDDFGVQEKEQYGKNFIQNMEIQRLGR